MRQILMKFRNIPELRFLGIGAAVFSDYAAEAGDLTRSEDRPCLCKEGHSWFQADMLG